MRKLGPGQLIIASHNDGKIREINDLVIPYGIEAVSAKKLGLKDPEETEKTFIGNASLKARAASAASNLPALSDDSGLEVALLDGAPGIYSARWAEKKDGTRDFAYGMEKLRQKLAEKGATQSPARFICALCLSWPDGHEEVFEGEVRGIIDFPPRGDKGFGYDPVFTPDGYDITFGEMDPAQKHAMSHRADAFAKLKKACLDNDTP